MTAPQEAVARMAAALLIKKGEVSISEIRALPLVENDEVALAVLAILSRRFDLERYQRRVGQTGMEWEDVICFRDHEELEKSREDS